MVRPEGASGPPPTPPAASGLHEAKRSSWRERAPGLRIRGGLAPILNTRSTPRLGVPREAARASAELLPLPACPVPSRRRTRNVQTFTAAARQTKCPDGRGRARGCPGRPGNAAARALGRPAALTPAEGKAVAPTQVGNRPRGSHPPSFPLKATTLTSADMKTVTSQSAPTERVTSTGNGASLGETAERVCG